MSKDWDGIDDFWAFLTTKAFIGSAVTIIIASVLLWLIKQFLIKKVAYSGKDEQHKNTFIGMIFNVMQYLVILVAVVIIMKLNGVNIGSILAGLGIVATIVGLALQDTLKDIISGINIYNNNFYKVGDLVRWNGEECDVKYFSARVTKFQSLRTNSTYTVCNSCIDQIEKIKDRSVICFRFGFLAEKEKIDAAMEKIVTRMKKECRNVRKIEYDGIFDIDNTGVGYEIKFSCAAHKREDVKDTLMAIAYEEFRAAEISPLFSAAYR